MLYKPDNWVMVEVAPKDSEYPPHYRIFATWSGAYLYGDSWKLNSGVTEVTDTGDAYEFTGSSGSVYRCRKNSYRLSAYGSSVLNGLIDSWADGGTIDVLNESTDFMSITYN